MAAWARVHHEAVRAFGTAEQFRNRVGQRFLNAAVLLVDELARQNLPRKEAVPRISSAKSLGPLYNAGTRFKSQGGSKSKPRRVVEGSKLRRLPNTSNMEKLCPFAMQPLLLVMPS